MRIALFLALAFFSPYSFALSVMIDPGHGGTDHGAVNSSLRESDITLKVSQYLKALLSADPQFKVKMTRERDQFLSLDRRAQLANEAKADLFISIHVNSSNEKHVRGKEIYFQNQLPPDEEALFLANRENQGIESRTDTVKGDVAAIVEDLERNHRLRLSGRLSEELFRNWGGDHYRRRTSIRQAPFYVISNVSMPSALVEIGYLSNPQEAEKLSDDTYLRKIAQGLYRAIVSYKEFVDKAAHRSLN